MGIGSAIGVTVRHQPSSPLSPASGQGSCFPLYCPIRVYLQGSDAHPLRWLHLFTSLS